MTVHGSIEHLITTSYGTTEQIAKAIFVNIYNFLNSANAQSIGIQLVANFYGNEASGFGFPGGANVVGNNAWACFAFTSATVPFYILIQMTGDENIGTLGGAPAMYNSSTTVKYVMAFSFAQRLDGGNPWNGGTAKNGADAKGTLVWNAGASTLFLSPRSNDSIRSGAH